MTETTYMVRYTAWMDADFGPEPVIKRAGPFGSEEAAEYWIERTGDRYHTNLADYPSEPEVVRAPALGLADLRAFDEIAPLADA